MNSEFFQDVEFVGEIYSADGLRYAEFENCIFKNCGFSNADLSDAVFSECTFYNCDLSMAKLTNASFRDVTFVNSKLLGLRFDECSKILMSFGFDSCTLNFSSFFQLKLKDTVFKDCRLHEVQFVETDLSGANFENSDLSGAVFDHTNLENADFRTAYNYSFDPDANRVKNAKFSLVGIAGLLDRFEIKIEGVSR